MPLDDDYFATASIDLFDSKVETLVITVYNAAIVGIKLRNDQEQEQFKACDRDAHPELTQESDWWEIQIRDMKYHAGNMGLVSLIVLFQHWLDPQDKIGWRTAFKQLEETLGNGPVSLAELDKMVTARDSIIHHRGKADFELRKNHCPIPEQYLDFDNSSKKGLVAIDESLLTDLAGKLSSQVDFWNKQRRKQRIDA